MQVSRKVFRAKNHFSTIQSRGQKALYKSKLATISDVAVGKQVFAMVSGKTIRGEVCFIDKKNDRVYLKQDICQKAVSGSSVTSLRKMKPGNIIRYGGGTYIEREDDTVDELNYRERKVIRTDPEWICKLIKKNRPYKLPIFINTYVFEAIVADLIKKEWARPTHELLAFTSKLMNTAAVTFIKEMKSIGSFTMLESFLVAKASEIVDSLTVQAKDKLEDFIKREQVPYTQNHYLFENFGKVRSQHLMDEVLLALPQGSSNTTVNPTSLASIVKNVFQRNQERSVDDHMAEEMQNALNSYGKVALKRFIDNVPMMCIEIMQEFADKMNNVLSATTDEEINRLVVAPANTVAKMNNLKRKAETLEKGIVALRELF